MTLAEWRSRHQELAERVRWARRAVPEPEDTFRAALEALTRALRLHLAQEERWLLPAFDRLADRAAPNQAPQVVRADHRRLEALLDSLAAATDRVERAVLLGALADVLDHHDRREAAGMLALLDQAHPDLVPTWLAAIRAEEDALPPWPDVPLAPVPARDAPADLDPLDALRWAAAHDQPLVVRIAVPDHPKGPPLHRRLLQAMEAAQEPTDLAAHRDRLGEVVDRLRLLALIRSR